MGLWIAMAVLAAAAAAASLAPLYRARADASADRAAGEIYRDQLNELSRDVDRGLIAEDEAEAARVEIARRLLKTAAGDKAAAGDFRLWRRAATVLAVLAPIAAVAVYLTTGAPTMPDRPLASRVTAPPADVDLDALITRVEAHLAESPEDGQGWEIIAPVYARIGRFDDALAAYGKALDILGATAEREANLGEAIMWANDGMITAEARAAFQRAVDLDPQRPRSRFYLARALEQEGRDEEAVVAWRDLLAGASPDQPWVAPVQAALDAANARLGNPAPAPTANDVAAAAELNPEDQQAMIEGMVASLAARLEDEPDDVQGWARLLRSYVVLDQKDLADAALGRARTALAENAEGLELVEATARELALEAKLEN